MKLALFKTLWGHQGAYDEAASQAASAGFDGMESPVPSDASAAAELKRSLRDTGLSFIAEVSTTGYAVPEPGSTVSDHLEALRCGIERSLPLEPLFVTAMAGSDLWTTQESIDFLGAATSLAESAGVALAIETHRSRSLFHPRIAAQLIQAVPSLQLTLDFSHWCVVAERLVIDELPHVLELCSQRALHIHARVGWAQGAQVPDPRVPAYANEVEAHLRWWEVIWKAQSECGRPVCTMTPEFGPDGYMATDPKTGRPVADLWEINRWMGEQLRAGFEVAQSRAFHGREGLPKQYYE